LNSGPFPPPALPGLDGRTGLSATPGRPAWPSRVAGRSHALPPPGASRVSWGLRVRACHRHYPGGTAGSDRSWDGLSQPFPSGPATSAFPAKRPGRLPRRSFRGLLDVHSRYGLPARRATIIARCLEGSGGFVTSTAAPIATGRSDPVAGWELHPLKTHDFHGTPPRRITGSRAGTSRRSSAS
jgi:hypothetical protein